MDKNSPTKLPPFRVFHGPRILAEKQNFNISRSNIPYMWKDTEGQGAYGVILDTGQPLPHPDLNVRGQGRSFIDNEDEFDRESFHSTWIAGVSEGIANNGMGVVGIANSATHHYGKVLANNGSGDLIALLRGLDWCIGLKRQGLCDVINMSLGFPNWIDDIPELKNACQQVKAEGITICCANGNAAGAIGQPAKYPSTIAVSAVDRDDLPATFTDYGKESDFTAMGVKSYSTWGDKWYAAISGTSMASPVIYNLALLIIAKHRAAGEELTPDEVYDHLKKLSVDIGSPGWDEKTGHGIVHFGESLPPSPPKRKPKFGLCSSPEDSLALQTVQKILQDAVKHISAAERLSKMEE